METERMVQRVVKSVELRKTRRYCPLKVIAFFYLPLLGEKEMSCFG